MTMWQHHVDKKGQHTLVGRCGVVEISATGAALDEVWKFASEIERSVDELIIPLVGIETDAPVPN
jgi:hypothetical protein